MNIYEYIVKTLSQLNEDELINENLHRIKKNISKNYKGAIFSAIASSIVSVLLGIFISYLVNAPTGASITLTFVTLWALSALYAKLK